MDGEISYLHFKSYYSVAAASDLLTRYNIRNRIVRAPITGYSSCSFAVVIDKKDEDMSKFIIETNGMDLN